MKINSDLLMVHRPALGHPLGGPWGLAAAGGTLWEGLGGVGGGATGRPRKGGGRLSRALSLWYLAGGIYL